MNNLECCPDCGTLPWELHKAGCEFEQCHLCGGQYIYCNCTPNDNEYKDFPFVPWSGELPGNKECRKYGIYMKFIRGRGWIKCNRHEPGAKPDLNRLFTQGKWNRKTQQFELPSTDS